MRTDTSQRANALETQVQRKLRIRVCISTGGRRAPLQHLQIDDANLEPEAASHVLSGFRIVKKKDNASGTPRLVFASCSGRMCVVLGLVWVAYGGRHTSRRGPEVETRRGYTGPCAQGAETGVAKQRARQSCSLSTSSTLSYQLFSPCNRLRSYSYAQHYWTMAVVGDEHIQLGCIFASTRCL